jgi:hypothetical protein
MKTNAYIKILSKNITFHVWYIKLSRDLKNYNIKINLHILVVFVNIWQLQIMHSKSYCNIVFKIFVGLTV